MTLRRTAPIRRAAAGLAPKRPKPNQEWAASRKAALARCGGRCESCGQAGPIQAHHRKPRRYNDHSVANVAILCSFDHGSIHAHPTRGYEQGWLLRGNDDPRTVPVPLWDGRLVRLSESYWPVLADGTGEA